jgi:transketolase
MGGGGNMKRERLGELCRFALEVRKDLIRMVGLARSGRISSSLSLVDLLVYLYEEVLRVSPKDPAWGDRDRLVLGKGLGAPSLYAVLARKGYFDREELWHYRRLGALLQAYPEIHRTPGVDAPGGALGTGLGIAGGIALALRLDGRAARSFCVLGDGEVQEGAIWEAALSVSVRKLSNLVVLVDVNGTGTGPWAEVKRVEPLADKFAAFGFRVYRAEGHDFESLEEAFSGAGREGEGPAAILARTRSGRGVSFLESGVRPEADPLSREEIDQALQELEESGAKEEGA